MHLGGQQEAKRARSNEAVMEGVCADRLFAARAGWEPAKYVEHVLSTGCERKLLQGCANMILRMHP